MIDELNKLSVALNLSPWFHLAIKCDWSTNKKEKTCPFPALVNGRRKHLPIAGLQKWF